MGLSILKFPTYLLYANLSPAALYLCKLHIILCILLYSLNQTLSSSTLPGYSTLYNDLVPTLSGQLFHQLSQAAAWDHPRPIPGMSPAAQPDPNLTFNQTQCYFLGENCAINLLLRHTGCPVVSGEIYGPQGTCTYFSLKFVI